MRTGLRILLLAGFTLSCLHLTSSDAEAQARHERVQVTPIKRAGKTQGARIKLTLRPERGYESGRLVLGRTEPNKWGPTTYREAATKPEKGYLVQELDRFTGVKQPTEKTIEVHYGKGNGLKPGDKVDLTSVWNSSSGTVHVWGMTRSGVPSAPITLPE
ncbi:MAG TPA: hypothetical protein VKZ63_20760 [Kofleriaceae bacterium]|nr:hypothetical protein [Kofleriaceae bacterium]